MRIITLFLQQIARHERENLGLIQQGIVRKDNLVVGITASGNNHKAARETSDRIRELLNQPEQ